MKQATFLICALLVLFQVGSTICDDTDTSTTANADTVTFNVSELSSIEALEDLSGRWDGYSANESYTTDENTLIAILGKYIQYFFENPKEFAEI